MKLKPLFDLHSRSTAGFPEVASFSTPDAFDLMNIGGHRCRRYASVAEAVEVSHTDADDDGHGNCRVSVAEEIQEISKEVGNEQSKQFNMHWRHANLKGTGKENYRVLKRRQVKIETEAWEQAVREYRELLNDMCEQKLAPNLPYMKTLFLGWFEPLRNKIAEEQDIKEVKSKAAYAKYFEQLPADMMAVITMHKLLSMLMTGGENGCARVVHAACAIGDAIEQEVGS